MRTLTVTRPHHLAKLTHELLAACPELAPRLIPDAQLPNGAPVRAASFKLMATGNTLRIVVPDDADDAAIQAVIAAHDPTPPPAPPVPDFGSAAYDLAQVADAVAAMRAFLTTPTPSAAQIVTQIKLIDTVLLALIKRSL